MPINPELLNAPILAQHPCGLLAVNKPTGMLSHPNEGGDETGKDAGSTPALLKAPYNFNKQAYETEDGPVHLLHRLDSPTSGVVLLATNAATARAVRTAFQQRQVEKRYAAAVLGTFKKISATWEDTLEKKQRTHTSGTYVRSQAGSASGSGPKSRNAAHTAITRVFMRGTGEALSTPLTLLEMRPKTGRTHQLRVQAAKHGFPILGDRTYGNFKFNKRAAPVLGTQRLMLHACSASLNIEIDGETIAFEAHAPLPEIFSECFPNCPYIPKLTNV